MMHFLWGLLYLLMTMVLVSLYILAALVLARPLLSALIFLFWAIKSRKSDVAFSKTREFRRKYRNRFFNRKFALQAGSFIPAFHVAVYISQRNRWMGDDNAHFDAKEFRGRGI
ncbi:hypothetical protein D3OALGA1CA_2049 [Olavius algarvensis associated proteobacterium Delta 3]|nr:hypothetical protein D3OALGA1CA_2049 [Olavius algarvensis associated proteobacterium Delta 3]